MKVYIVMGQSGYEDIWVEAVLSSKNRAKAFIKKEEEESPSRWAGSSMWIEIWKVNGEKEED